MEVISSRMKIQRFVNPGQTLVEAGFSSPASLTVVVRGWYSEHIMKAQRKRFRYGDYALIWFFLGASAIGIVGIVSLTHRSAAVAVIAPTPDEYRAAAKVAMGPFLTAAKPLTVDAFDGPTAATLAPIVNDAQQRLLAMRVPGSFRDAHLAMVLTLERWKVALGGDASAREAAVSQLHDVLAANPWLDPSALAI